jgi:hypothetical protein
MKYQKSKSVGLVRLCLLGDADCYASCGVQLKFATVTETTPELNTTSV